MPQLKQWEAKSHEHGQVRVIYLAESLLLSVSALTRHYFMYLEIL